jgi:hypothetical protein
VVALWRKDLQKINPKAAESLADPAQYSNLFPNMDWALKAEQFQVRAPREKDGGKKTERARGLRVLEVCGSRRTRGFLSILRTQRADPRLVLFGMQNRTFCPYLQPALARGARSAPCCLGS